MVIQGGRGEYAHEADIGWATTRRKEVVATTTALALLVVVVGGGWRDGVGEPRASLWPNKAIAN
jgi:hypothetical protein